MAKINAYESLSYVKFSLVVDKAEQQELLSECLGNLLKSMQLSFDVELADLQDSEKKWYIYYSVVKADDIHTALTALTEFGSALAIDAEPFGFEKGTTFIGSMVELLTNEHQSEEASAIEGQQVEYHTLTNLYTLSLRNRLLLKRIGDLEARLSAQEKSHEALSDNVRGQKVMNFDYNAFHQLPYLMTAIVKSIGDEKLQRTFDELFEEERFNINRIH